MAIEAAKFGANVTLIARNPVLLEEARAEILSHLIHPDQKVNCVSRNLSWLLNF